MCVCVYCILQQFLLVVNSKFKIGKFLIIRFLNSQAIPWKNKQQQPFTFLILTGDENVPIIQSLSPRSAPWCSWLVLLASLRFLVVATVACSLAGLMGCW